MSEIIDITEYILLIGTLIMVLLANAFVLWVLIQEVKEVKKRKKADERSK